MDGLTHDGLKSHECCYFVVWSQFSVTMVLKLTRLSSSLGLLGYGVSFETLLSSLGLSAHLGSRLQYLYARLGLDHLQEKMAVRISEFAASPC